MDKSIVFKLVKKTRTQDGLLQWVSSTSDRTVYGQIGSVSADEFFSGGQAGFKPEYRITMFGPDYEGEDLAEVFGTLYSIYRTYQTRDDMIELYLEKRTGLKETETTTTSSTQTEDLNG